MSSSPLTEQQASAITSNLKPILIIAGPGTGKTEVLVRRYEYLISKQKIDPKKILYVTLANASVNDFQNKLFKYCPKLSKTIGLVQAFTFYGFCREILNEDKTSDIDYSKQKIYTDEECYPLIRETLSKNARFIFNENNIEILHNLFKKIRKLQHQNKTEADLEEVLQDIPKDSFLTSWSLKKILFHYKSFYSILNSNQIMTFDDAAIYTDKLLNKPDILKKWTNKYEEVLCDEFQDLDEIQLEILKKVSIVKKNLFCVGDPDQAIYCFRGASPSILQKFIDYFKKGEQETFIYKLEKNFRSTPEILNLANKFINSKKTLDNTLKKELYTENSKGEKPKLYIARDEEEHAQLIIQKIKEIIQQGDSYSSIAILSRKKFEKENKKEEVFLSCLEKENIGYINLKNKCIIHEALHIPLVRILLHFLNAVFLETFPYKDLKKLFELLNLKEALTTEIKSWGELLHSFKSKKEKIEGLEEIEKNFKTAKRIVSKNSSLKEKCKVIATSLSIFKGFFVDQKGSAILNRFISKVGIAKIKSWDLIVDDIQTCLFNYEKINLGTIHQAKGLEFKHVFLYKTDVNNYPIAKGFLQTKGKPELQKIFLEEERNVFYVGITRAKKTLTFFSSAEKDNLSPFVEEIKDLVEITQ